MRKLAAVLVLVGTTIAPSAQGAENVGDVVARVIGPRDLEAVEVRLGNLVEQREPRVVRASAVVLPGSALRPRLPLPRQRAGHDQDTDHTHCDPEPSH